jgi:hypothetical protein
VHNPPNTTEEKGTSIAALMKKSGKDVWILNNFEKYLNNYIIFSVPHSPESVLIKLL